MTSTYLLAGQTSELERLRLQSEVWEPAGRAFAARLAPPRAAPSALDYGCGVMGWLRVLSEWAGPAGTVTGADIDEKMLSLAREFVAAERLANVALARDDLFASALPRAAFDLVHARFQIAPLGRAGEQLATYRERLRPGGWLVLEDPDWSSWRVHPEAPAVAKLIALIDAGFRAAGGNLGAGPGLPGLLEPLGDVVLDAAIVALPPGHPYLKLPLQFAAALRSRLETIVGAGALDAMIADARAELERPHCWGTTFTLIQAAVRVGA
jgi:SAM-dependent methyltransferase